MSFSILAALMLVTTAPDDFREKVAPILQARCVSCHGETARKDAQRRLTDVHGHVIQEVLA